MKKTVLFLLMLMPISLFAQNVMTPELLWTLGRVSALGASPDGEILLYSIAKTDLKTEKSKSKFYFVNIKSNQTQETDVLKDKSFIQWDENGLYAKKEKTLFKSTDNGKTWTEIYNQLEDAMDVRISPNGKIIAFSKEVQVNQVLGKDIYDDAKKSTAQIYTDLDYRHWDKWNEGKVNHVFVAFLDGSNATVKDILGSKHFECPRKPFGGSEDFIFTKDSKGIIYVTKELTGKEAMQSTNTDLFHYDIVSETTRNLTEGMMGYDLTPQLSPDGTKLAWTSMKRDGFEADKVDLMVMDLASGSKFNLTTGWDETVDGDFKWAKDGQSIYFTASLKGTQQLFSVDVPKNLNEIGRAHV